MLLKIGVRKLQIWKQISKTIWVSPVKKIGIDLVYR